jgi:hypothetical protein
MPGSSRHRSERFTQLAAGCAGWLGIPGAAPPRTASADETIFYWCHIFSPLDLLADYETITEGLAEAKRAYRAALAAHDWAKATGLLQEVNDLTHLAAECAAGLALSRSRHLAHGKAWPLRGIG